MNKLLTFAAHLGVKHVRKRDHKKGPILGWEVFVPREGQKPVRTRLYRPVNCSLPVLPVLFNVHGGSGSSATARAWTSNRSTLRTTSAASW